MRRRSLAALCAAALTQPLTGRAQESARTLRLGWLRPNRDVPDDFQSSGIPAALEARGWVRGRNLVIESRFANGQVERLPELARELVQARCDLLLAVGAQAVQAARAASASLPVVMFGNFDPVARGLISSLARPGGQITGTLIAPDGTLAAKKLELLLEAVPGIQRLGFLAPDDPVVQAQINELRSLPRAGSLEIVVATVSGGRYDTAFAQLAARRVQALFVGAHTFFMTDRRQIIAMANERRLPSIWEWAEQVRDGGLMAYGTSLSWLYARVADQIDRIARGASPADTPVERPTRFELAVNRRTARTIGLSLPTAFLLRADEVVE